MERFEPKKTSAIPALLLLALTTACAKDKTPDDDDSEGISSDRAVKRRAKESREASSADPSVVSTPSASVSASTPPPPTISRIGPFGGCSPRKQCEAVVAKPLVAAPAPFERCPTKLSGSTSAWSSFDAVETGRGYPSGVVPKSGPINCCYLVSMPCPGGRALIVDGQQRVASLVPRADRARSRESSDRARSRESSYRARSRESSDRARSRESSDRARSRESSYRARSRESSDEGLRPESSNWCLERAAGPQNDEQAARWLREALGEHASIAVFANLARELLFHGAPLSLVRACQVAATEEIEHAKACFSLAASSGTVADPGPLLGFQHGSTAAPRPLLELARESLLDGVFGEGLSACSAGLAKHHETGLKHQVLAAIEQEELAHAMLAARIVGFAVGKDPSIKSMILKALDEMPWRAPPSYGVLTEAELWGLSGDLRDTLRAF